MFSGKKFSILRGMKIFKIQILKHLRKKNKDEVGDNQDKDNIELRDDDKIIHWTIETSEDNKVTEYNEYSEYNLKTSTPMKMKRLEKIIILHEVSDLKIYEDLEHIENIDISAVTLFEGFEEEDQITNEHPELRIYENIDQLYPV